MQNESLNQTASFEPFAARTLLILLARYRGVSNWDFAQTDNSWFGECPYDTF